MKVAGACQDGYKMTELGELPENWQIKELGEVATLQRGKDLPNRLQIPGQYPIVGSSGIIGYHIEKVCNGPGVVTGRSGSIGNVAYVEGDYWPHNTGLYVRDFHGNHERYVYYLLLTMDFKKYATGVSVPTLNRNFVHTVKLAVTTNYPEQQKIAAVLSAVQEAKEKTEAVISAARELKRSMMKHLFTYGPVPVADAVQVRLKETEIGEMPEHWDTKYLGEMCEFKNGINFGREQKGNIGIPTIDVLNMYPEGIAVNLSDLYRVDINLKNKDEYILSDKDILIVRSSLKREGVGWACLFVEIKEPVTFCGFIIRARIIDGASASLGMTVKGKTRSRFLGFARNDRQRQNQKQIPRLRSE